MNAARAGSYNPREERLKVEREILLRLNSESENVRVHEEPAIGRSPEKYTITFHCLGIVGIERITQAPKFDSIHRAEIYCDNDFPTAPPKLRWLTEIWHPNIRHYGDKGVCINRKQWLAGMSLAEICYQMFDMVQYRNYHAVNVDPYPYDDEAARWVLNYAEPKGIVNKSRGKSVDNRPFWKPSIHPQFEPRSPFDQDSKPVARTPQIKILASPKIRIL